MARWLVLGLGNRLSGADAFGPEVAERLRQSGLPGSVDVVDADTDLFAFLDRFPAYDHVVLVDAVIGSGEARVTVVEEETFRQWPDDSPSAHELSPVMCVKLFRALQGEDRADRPVITLVTLVVHEDQFRDAPARADIESGAAVVRGLVGA